MKRLANRIVAMGLSASMLLSVSGAALAAQEELSGHWAADTLSEWVDAGYLKGDENGNLMPDSAVSRAEFMTMMNRRAGYTEKADIGRFTDVNSDEWYYDDVAIAVAAGYLNGTGETTMSPTSKLTRQEMAVIMARICALEDNESALSDYSDAEEFADWAKGPAGAVVEAGLLQGDTIRLTPLAQASRAESVVVINRMVESGYIIPNSEQAAVPTQKYQDGTYTGTGAGYGGTVTLSVTITDGRITAIDVVSQSETYAYWNRAKKLIDTILEQQGTDGIDTISGATISSTAILTAVNDALGQAMGNASTGTTGYNTSGGEGASAASRLTKYSRIAYDDYYLVEGTYTGEAYGYGGRLKLEVTVSGGEIYDITVTSNSETISYYNSAKKVIERIQGGNTTDLDTISGATVSSKAILAAVENALEGAMVGEKSTLALSEVGSSGVYGDSGITAVSAVTDETKLSTYLGYAAETYGSALSKDSNLVGAYDVEGAQAAQLLLPITTYDSDMVYTIYRVDATTAEAVDTQALYLSGTYYALTATADFGTFVLVMTPREMGELENVSIDMDNEGIKQATVTLAVSKESTAKNASDGIYYDYEIDINVWYYEYQGKNVLVALGIDESTYYEVASGKGINNGDQIVNHEYVEDMVDELTQYFAEILTGREMLTNQGLVDAYTGATVSYNALYQLLLAEGYCLPTGAILAIQKVEDYVIELTQTSIEITVADTAILVNSSTELQGGILKITNNTTGETTREAITDKGSSLVKLGTYSASDSYTVKVILADYAAEITMRAWETDGYLYATMNIPYANFYAAEGTSGITKGVDAVTTASTGKWKSGDLIAGAYTSDTDEEYGAILGISYPVAITVQDYKTLLDQMDSLRGSQKTVKIYNADATGSTPKEKYVDTLDDVYSYSVTDVSVEQPTAYKVASFSDGEITFSAVKSNGAAAQSKAINPEGAGVNSTYYKDEFTLKTGDETTYGDYELDFSDTANNTNNFPVAGTGIAGIHNTSGVEYPIELMDGSTETFQIYGMILQTTNTNSDTDGGYYAMRHMENIWWGSRYGLELAWSSGVQEYVHSSSLLDTTSYAKMQGETMKQVIFITDKGYYTLDWAAYFAKIPTDYSLSVADASADAGSTAIRVSGLDQYAKSYSVTGPSASDSFTFNGDTVSWTGSVLPGTYTLTLEDGNGVWAALTTTFTLATGTIPVTYSAAQEKLIADTGATEADLENYIASITSVSVNGTSYATTGRNAVTIINTDGTVNSDASAFADSGTYTLNITSTGYTNDYSFSVTMTKYVYGTMNIPYADFYANEFETITKGVDAVTTASNSKWKSESMVFGAYTSDASEDYGAILGITYPVMMTAEDYATLEKKLDTLRADLKTVYIYDNASTASEPRDKYSEKLEDTYSYTFTALTSRPETYKLVSFSADGEIEFSALMTNGAAAETKEIDPDGAGYVTDKTYMDEFTLKTGDETTYGDYQLDFSDTANNTNNFPVGSTGNAGYLNTTGAEIGIHLTGGEEDTFQIYGIVIKTTNTNSDTDGGYYVMRHMENIWWGSRYGLEVAWSSGVQEYVHSSSLLDITSYVNMQGETMEAVIFVTDKGYYTLDWEAYFAKIPTDYSLSVANAVTDAGSTVITVSGLDQYDKSYSVTGPSASDSFTVNGDTVSWTGSVLPGTYTLTLEDGDGVWVALTTTFTLTTETIPVTYSAAQEKLIADADADLENYIASITSVSVNGTSYATTGRNAVTIINTDGTVNSDASAFTEAGTYTIVITATGYTTNYSFSFAYGTVSAAATGLLIPAQADGAEGAADDSGDMDAQLPEEPTEEADAAQAEDAQDAQDASAEEEKPTQESDSEEEDAPLH